MYTQLNKPPTDGTIQIISKNVVRMLNDRNIHGTDTEIENIPDCENNFLWGIVRDDRWACVYITIANRSSVTSILEFCKPSITNCIIIYKNSCTVTAGKDMSSCKTMIIEKFSYKEMALCPLDWGFQDKYRLLSPEETLQLHEDYGLNNLPIILLNDRMQRHYNAPIGSVYEITEIREGLQPIISYRVVSELK